MYIIKNFIRSLYDFKYYKQMCAQPKWKGFLYLTVLSLLLGITIYIPLGVANRESYAELYTIISENSPDFEIRDNTLSIEAESPYTVYEQDGKGLLIVLDENNAVSQYSYQDYAYLLLLLKDRVYIKMDGMDTTFFYTELFRYLPEQMINKATLLSYIAILKSTSFIMIILLVLFFAVTIHFGALVIGLFGRFLAIFKKVLGMKIMDAYHIACYASTLPLLMTAVILFFGINFSYLQLVYVLLGILYFWNALTYLFPKQETMSKEF